MKMQDLLTEGKYLPKRFRDFHDMKDLFKLIHWRVEMPKEVEHISWIDAQIYVVDIFLHFMAKRGYTLQKARHSIEFNNLDNEIKEMRSYMIKQLEDALQSKDEQ